jgi:hypothetical protein
MIQRRDAIALAILLGLTTLIMIHRWIFDDWTSRHDLLAFFIPWYGYLGDRLASGDIPGWNPYLFGGSPFAGDPESGWMYFPAMLLFPFLSVITAFKAMILLQLLIAGTATYAFGRVLGFGAAAALLSAIIYEFGPFLFVQTDCCTVASHLSTWVPVGFLGAELALRARVWIYRLSAWFLAGLAISQMLAGWVGQGAVNGLLILGAWVGYRTLISPPVDGWTLRTRIIQALMTGPAIVIIGLGISAAGLLPRLAVNAQSNNPGGTYEGIRGATNEDPYELWWLLRNLLTSEFEYRAVSLGGLTVTLALLALFVVRRRYAVPFFAGLTLAICILAMDTTILHRVLYLLIPTYEAMHVHGPRRVLWMAPIAPAMMAGATLQVLPCIHARLSRPLQTWIVFVPLLVIIACDFYITTRTEWIGWQTYLTAGLTTLAVYLVVISQERIKSAVLQQRFTQAMIICIVALAFVLPHVRDFAASINDPDGLTQPNNLWQHNPTTQAAVETNLARTDPGGAGEFLQRQSVVLQPFRYVSYSSRGYDPAPLEAYPGRRLDPVVMALLTNGRPFRLGLQQIQGYNPLLLGNWYHYMGLLNHYVQNYHYTDLLDSGAQSPLLDMLNVRYILIDATLPPDRADIVEMTQGRTEVFRNELVVVYENPEAFPRAWIVSNVQSARDEVAMSQLNSGAVDGRYTAFVEGEAPVIPHGGTSSGATPDSRSGAGTVTVTNYAADEMTFRTDSASGGFMVASEVYEEGWKAYLDGEEVEIYETNGLFRGIVLPPGEHEVEMRYEPTSLTIGLWVTGVFSLAAIAVWAFAAGYWLQGCVWQPIP